MPGPGKKFEKGHAGMGGRPKLDEAFRASCRELTPLVLEKWKAEVEKQGEHWVKCSELITAYGHGRPTQSIAGADGEGPVEVVVRTVADEG